MSISYMLLWAFIIFYFAMGMGTVLKHQDTIKKRHIPYCMFSLPGKVIVKSFALLPVICSIVYINGTTKKEVGEDSKATLVVPVEFFR